MEQVALREERRAPIWLRGAVFEEPAFFYGWRFCLSVNFDGVRFEQGATIYGAVFERDGLCNGNKMTVIAAIRPTIPASHFKAAKTTQPLHNTT